MTHVGSDVLKTFLCELKTVVQRITAIHLCEVFGILLQKCRAVSHYGISYGKEYIVALVIGNVV